MLTITPRPTAVRTRGRIAFDVTLDAAQQRAVEAPVGQCQLLLGEAGHGKTTVAIHRLAWLYRATQRRFRAAMIVPSEGLCRSLQPVLTHLGIDVFVRTYDVWATRQARPVFTDLPKRLSEGTRWAVSQLKRDTALMPILEEMAAKPPERIDDDYDAPPPNTAAYAHRGDLQHLFGDRLRLERLAAISSRRISPKAIEAMLEHTRSQFRARSEDTWAHVDADKLVTVDAHSLDHGTVDHDADSVDVEDFAVLFALDRRRAACLGVSPSRPRRFDCLVVDEAQEFAPLELELIGRSLAPGGTLVVAGDGDQQLDPGVFFSDWPVVMRHLGVERYDTVILEASYRCPVEVVAWARSLRSDGPAAVSSWPVAAFDTEAHLIAELCEAFRQLIADDPWATIALIVRTPMVARRIFAALRAARIASMLVLDGRFVPHRGVDVTTIDQVKGLEFDYVVVADVNQETYPDEAEPRRALYVAVTRTRHQLLLTCVGRPSPLAQGRS